MDYLLTSFSSFASSCDWSQYGCANPLPPSPFASSSLSIRLMPTWATLGRSRAALVAVLVWLRRLAAMSGSGSKQTDDMLYLDSGVLSTGGYIGNWTAGAAAIEMSLKQPSSSKSYARQHIKFTTLCCKIVFYCTSIMALLKKANNHF